MYVGRGHQKGRERGEGGIGEQRERIGLDRTREGRYSGWFMKGEEEEGRRERTEIYRLIEVRCTRGSGREKGEIRDGQNRRRERIGIDRIIQGRCTRESGREKRERMTAEE